MLMNINVPQLYIELHDLLCQNSDSLNVITVYLDTLLTVKLNSLKKLTLLQHFLFCRRERQ